MNWFINNLIGGGLALLVIIISDYQDSFFDNNWITKIRRGVEA